MKYLSIIEEYFSDNLKEQDLANFKLELKTNSEFRDEFEIYKHAVDFIRSQENKIRTDVSSIKDFEFDPDLILDIQKYGGSKPIDEDEELLDEILPNENKRILRKNLYRSIIIRWSKVAAMGTILLGLGMIGFIIVPKFTINNEDLFDKFYKPYSHSSSKRSAGEMINISLAEGISFYDKRDYSSALSKFQIVPDSLKVNPELTIVEGVSLIELGKYQDALIRFEKINEDNLLYTISLWYQGLCYLKLHEEKNAKEVFRKLKTYSPYYQKETKKLLRYL